MRLSKICGIPVRLIYRRESGITEIHPRGSDLLPYQRRLIAGWMEHRGYRVEGLQWSYVPVQGPVDINVL